MIRRDNVNIFKGVGNVVWGGGFREPIPITSSVKCSSTGILVKSREHWLEILHPMITVTIREMKWWIVLCNVVYVSSESRKYRDEVQKMTNVVFVFDVSKKEYLATSVQNEYCNRCNQNEKDS